jgi:hypothetical protein
MRRARSRWSACRSGSEICPKSWRACSSTAFSARACALLPPAVRLITYTRRSSGSRLVQAAVGIYPAFVPLVIVATGNHFVFDALAGVAASDQVLEGSQLGIALEQVELLTNSALC